MRGASYALAAAFSSAQTMGLCSFDEAHTIRTPRAAILSLRTLQLLMEEVGLRDTVDPLAGSYFIETITKEMEHKIEEEMEKIEKVGGIIEAVSTGYAQRTVAHQAYAFEKGIQSGELHRVGVNIYTDEEPKEVELHEYDAESAQRQIEGLRAIKRERNNSEVTRTLTELEQAAKTGKNVMPFLVDCCKAYATVGEMARVFRNIYGEFQEPSVF